MRIREARVEDGAVLARVQIDSWRDTYAGIMPDDYLAQFTYEEQEQDWRDLVSAEEREAIFVAETDDGDVAGYVGCGPEKSGNPDFRGEVYYLHVRRAYQGQGVGRQLLAAAVDHLKKQGITSLLIWVLAENRSRAFYERLDGKLVAEKTVEVGGTEVLEVAYGWDDTGDVRLRTSADEA